MSEYSGDPQILIWDGLGVAGKRQDKFLVEVSIIAHLQSSFPVHKLLGL